MGQLPDPNHETIQDCRVKLITIYLQLGYKYVYQPGRYMPLLASERYKTALNLIEEALKINSHLEAKLYYLKAQTLTYMGDLKVKENQYREAIFLLVQSLETNCMGLEIIKNLENEKKYLTNMKECVEKCLSIFQQVPEKENNYIMLATLKKLHVIVTSYTTDQFNSIKQTIKAIQTELKPKTGFWQSAFFSTHTYSITNTYEDERKNSSNKIVY